MTGFLFPSTCTTFLLISTRETLPQNAQQKLYRLIPCNLERIYFFERKRAMYAQYSSNGKDILVHAYHLGVEPQEKVLTGKGMKRGLDPGIETRLGEEWDRIITEVDNSGVIQPRWCQWFSLRLFLQRCLCRGDHIIPSCELMPEVLWTRGCSPTSASMVLGYYDNYVPVPAATGGTAG